MDPQHWSVLLKDHHEGDISWEAAAHLRAQGRAAESDPGDALRAQFINFTTVQLNMKHRLPELVDREKVVAARAGLPAEEVVRGAVEVFKVLSSPVRVCIMHALAHDELSVGDLARVLDLSLSVASHQLALLRRTKLVAARGEAGSR